jgi:hypothetical protein
MMDASPETNPTIEEGAGLSRADLAEAVRASALLADLTISRWSGEMTDRKISAKLKEDANAVGNTGRFIKNLLSGVDAPLKKVHAAFQMARITHYSLTLPWVTNPHQQGGGNGARLLPTALFERYMSEMSRKKRDAEDERDKFLADYADLCTRALANLAGLADPADYPPVEEVRKSFRLSFGFTPIPESASFPALPGTMLDRLSERLLARQEYAIQSAQAEIWVRVREHVENLHDRVSDPDSNFKSAAVENVREMITLLPGFNTARDPRVTNIVTDIRNMLGNLSPKDIRSSPEERERVAGESRAIMDKLDQWKV